MGWAPLPPEATCRVGIGISTWVDRECDIGPECYVFVNVRHFGSDFHTCGCMLERNRYVNIIEHTVNITNISYTNVNITNVNVTMCHQREHLQRRTESELVQYRD